MIINILLYILFALVLILVIALLRQKNTITKLIFLGSITTITSLIICTIASYERNDYYIDMALIYFFLSSIATSAYLKYYLKKSEQ
jgi:multisubunit Na+/H+ antiporter MnhF subunit